MPELPEVQTVCSQLAGQLPGAVLTEVTFTRSDLRYPMPIAAVENLVGHRVKAVRRRSKYLIIEFAAQPAVLVHLGMSGRLFVENVPPETWRKHEHWRWSLIGPAGPRWLRYVDARRFGLLDVTELDGSHPLLAHLGPEPLEPAFSPEHLHAGLQRRSIAVKVAIMDAALVVGVGNIYASEACFRAAIAPQRAGNAVTAAEAERLHAAIVAVLQAAIAAGGSTLRDFVGGDESPGYFQQQHNAYGRHGLACLRCADRGVASLVVRAVLAQRATFWCPTCQT